jgi:quaternary ammonium compound-resistance protein SugE
MELLFVVLGGVILGLIVRYSVPRRWTNGVLLLPALGGAVSAVVWVALTWAGLKWDAGFIWWLTFAATALVCAAVAIVLGRNRERQDETRLLALSRANTGRRPGQNL